MNNIQFNWLWALICFFFTENGICSTRILEMHDIDGIFEEDNEEVQVQ